MNVATSVHVRMSLGDDPRDVAADSYRRYTGDEGRVVRIGRATIDVTHASPEVLDELSGLFTQSADWRRQQQGVAV